jgi:hypothetical protein
MTTITWTGNAHDGFFNNGNNWSPTSVPSTTDDVIIAPGTVTTITSPSAATIHSISLNANTTLIVSTGNFSVTAGTNGSGIAGTIDVSNNQNLSLGGGVVNSGIINLQSTGNATSLRFTSDTTLSGGGQLGYERGDERQLHRGHRAVATAQRGDESDAVLRQRRSRCRQLPPRRRQRHRHGDHAQLTGTGGGRSLAPLPSRSADAIARIKIS